MTEQEDSIKKEEIQADVGRVFLKAAILTLLQIQPRHGYELIGKARKIFNLTTQPSTLYPLLVDLEKNNYVISKWNIEELRPKKMYSLTPEGQEMLSITKDTINAFYQKISNPLAIKAEEEA